MIISNDELINVSKVEANSQILDPLHGIDGSINKLNFTKLKVKLFLSKSQFWTGAKIDYAELEYKKFLTLNLIYPEIMFIPSTLVDKFWHQHILDTQSYVNDCNAVFGDYLHHQTSFDRADSKKAQQAIFENNIELYQVHFGQLPSNGFEEYTTAVASPNIELHYWVPSECSCRSLGISK